MSCTRYGRSRMTIDPHTCLQCRDGARWVFTDQAGICLHQAPSAVRCWASRMKGELHPTENRVWGGLFLRMGDSVE